MKRVLVVFLLLPFLGFAQQRLACVDPGKILSESQLVKSKENELRSRAEQYQKQLDQINKRLEDLKKQIESRGIAQSVREQRIKEYQKTEAEGVEIQQKAQRELSELKGKMEEDIINRVRAISEDIAKKQGFTAVLDCSAFVYKSAEMDITKEVIQRLDQQR
ncbi:MAG: OmpH family outer membrane protein [Aquificaceae bacterium]|nr:OmpH family outer membrane protein [Aquificaceae bacterium]MCX8060708.1 OmpH family outer membrane protein [Aquificaceae bacterium]MDW8096736.1 OmpH family outer membrane protein [Aquificaceae bacterium]